MRKKAFSFLLVLSVCLSVLPVPVRAAERETGAADFMFTAPADLVYSGEPKIAEVTSLVDGMGAITVKYYKDGAEVEQAVDAGEYTVKIDVEQGDGCAAAQDLTADTWKFTIAKAVAEVITAPTGAVGLTYNKKAQALVSVGEAFGGTMQYSRDNVRWVVSVPKATKAGDYTVYYKVSGDDNHTDSAEASVSVTIAPKVVAAPVIILSEDNFVYDGTAKEPSVLVKDGETVIPSDEYTISYSNNVNAGTATVTVTDEEGGDYTVSGSKIFTIAKSAAAVTAAPGKVTDLFYNGQAQTLITASTAADGTMQYKLGDTGTYSTELPTAVDSGTYTVYYKAVGDVNHTDSLEGFVSVVIAPKEVAAPTIDLTPDRFVYDGSPKEPFVIVKDGENVIFPGEYSVSYSDNVEAGTATVTVTSKDDGNYRFSGSKTFAITKAEAAVITAPAGVTGLRYTGSKQALVTVGTASHGIMEYSFDEIRWFVAVPKAVNAGTYTVYYKAMGNENYIESAVGSCEVTVAKAALTIKVQDKEMVTGGALPEFTYTVSGFVNGETESVLTTKPTVTCAADGQTSGTYKITASGAEANNYQVSYEHGTLTVNEHVHSWTYAADDETDTITGTCTGEGCTVNGAAMRFSVPDNLTYTGTAKHIVVTGSIGSEIPQVTYTGGVTNGQAINAGNYTAEIMLGMAQITVSFQIEKAAPAVMAPTAVPGLSYTGSARDLLSAGTATGGTVQYKLGDGGTYRAILPKAVDAGTYTVYYKVVGDANHTDIAEQAISVTIAPREITPIIVLSGESFVYDGSGKEPDVTVIDGGTVIPSTEYTVDYSDHINAGTATVTVTDKVGGNYVVNGSKSFEITKAAAVLTETPAGAADLIYTGSAQPLVSAGAAVGGTVQYSLDGESWSEMAPTVTDAGTYTVYYKAAGDKNHLESAVGSCTVTIAKAALTIQAQDKEMGMGGTLPEFTYTVTGFVNGEMESVLATKPTVTCAADGKMVGTYQITVSGAAAANYTIHYVDGTLRVAPPYIPGTIPSDPVPTVPQEQGKVESDTTGQTTVSPEVSTKGDLATAEISGTLENRIINEAVEHASEQIVIAPEIDEKVNKAEIKLPAATVEKIGTQTDADLTFATPTASVTIPNGGLSGLADKGGTVTVTMEKWGGQMIFEVAANHQRVDKISGGVTMRVPCEVYKSGMVAVRVHGDGTREVIRKSVADPDDMTLTIPLHGSATVEIVDNSKRFRDVKDDDWYADAVAFATAHQLFSGTSDTTFSPDTTMTRGMLAVVLHNLDNNPESTFKGEFPDVKRGQWYETAVYWAAENGIVSGYSDGSFGGGDIVTREQLAVMLWNYSGCPESDYDLSRFNDHEQISGYARQACAWAAERGILNGIGGGAFGPKGQATRAQVAQMLKNYLEVTN